MVPTKALFVSGSLGLGHITRDMVIANRLRDAVSGLDIVWLSSGTAAKALLDAGEKLVDGSEAYADENADAESVAKGQSLNLVSYLIKARKSWRQNARVFSEIVSRQKFDLVVGDETYEIVLELRSNPRLKKWPFAMIFDFLGLDAMTKSPVERVGVYAYNRTWCADYRKPSVVDLGLFVGEKDDIPDRSFGFLLPNRRRYAEDRKLNFLGYIVPFNPPDYSDRSLLKQKLGYGAGPLVVCSIGGTSIGKELLELCAQAFPIASQSAPGLKMVLVCGPRLDPTTVSVPAGVETRGYVPALYEHFAASDVAVVQGGGTTTLELTALGRPFVFFPVEGHSEGQVVLRRLARHGAGTMMSLSRTTPEDLARQILDHLHSGATYPAIAMNGAREAAGLLAGLLS